MWWQHTQERNVCQRHINIDFPADTGRNGNNVILSEKKTPIIWLEAIRHIDVMKTLSVIITYYVYWVLLEPCCTPTQTAYLTHYSPKRSLNICNQCVNACLRWQYVFKIWLYIYIYMIYAAYIWFIYFYWQVPFAQTCSNLRKSYLFRKWLGVLVRIPYIPMLNTSPVN